jgi:ACS family hexuronate transporter-like MFS transporter
MLWIVAALLFLATAVNYLDRLALPIVSPLIRSEFHMSEEDYGQILTLFLFAYAIMYAGSGYVVDRLGAKRGFALFISFWSAASMLHGLATGKWSLGLYRFLLGLGEPGNWPAAAKAVNEWFPARFRALGVGIFNAGSSIGSAIAPPAVAFLTLRFGWRAAFLFTGAAGLLWLLAWLFLYDSPHRSRWIRPSEYARLSREIPAAAEAKPAGAEKVPWHAILFARECYTLIVARFFTDPVIYFVIFWLPEYLHKERGFDTAMIGRYAWVPYVFGGIGGVTGGLFSARLIRKGWSVLASRKAVMLCGAALVPGAILAPLVPNAGLAIAAVCLVTLGHAFWVANLQALPAGLFPAWEVGTATGFSGAGGSVGGMIANLGTGWIVHHFTYAPVFLIAGLMHPLSIAIVYAMLPERRFHVSRLSRTSPSGPRHSP